MLLRRVGVLGRRFGAAFAALLGLLVACGSDETTPAGAGGAAGEGGAGGTGGEAGASTVDPRHYLDSSLGEQVAAVDSGILSCEGLVEAYLERIADRDEGPDGINAVTSLAADPLVTAAAIDAEPGTGLPLLCGVIVVKDNIDVANLATTAGSLAMADNVVANDAPMVARLRAQGSVLIGKSNLSEWANFRGFDSTSGWSSLGGQTLNGANPDYNPCGSSSGSAAAVAAGIVSAAIGTETDGSITCPAAVNGVVGFKPTVGLVSRAGIVPISHVQDTAGPITKTVADAARLLGVMAGQDPRDPATSAIPANLNLEFEAVIQGADLDGMRLGRVLSMVGYDGALDSVLNAEIARMEAAGATVVPVQLPTGSGYGADEFTALLHEFKVGVNQYLADHGQAGQPTTLAELIAFNEANAAEVMPHFWQGIFEMAEETTGLDAPAYIAARQSAVQVTLDDGIVAVMAAETLDAFIAPTMGPAWETNYQDGDQYFGASASGPAAVAGCPHITVPMGEVVGLPVGLSIFAGRWDDAKVLRLAHAYEQLGR